MGLIDGDTRELALIVDGMEMLTEGFCEGVFWGNIEKPGPWMALR